MLEASRLRVSLCLVSPTLACFILDVFVSYLCESNIDQARESETIKRASKRQLGLGREGWAGLILFVQVHCNAACGVNIFHFITPGPGPGPVCSPGPCLSLISAVPGLWKT